MTKTMISTHTYRTPFIFSIFAAPLLMILSTFFWKNGEYGLQGGMLVILASIFWIPALAALFNLIAPKYPRYAAWGWIIATAGFVSGICFGFLGMITDIFQISHLEYLDAFAKHPLETNIVLFWPGPLAPLSLLVLGIQFLRSRVVPSWVALTLCLGAIAFPASRIPRIEWIAHIADLLQFIPLAYIGWKMAKS